MAAYAALVSLINILEQIKNHPRLSFAFDIKQIESLCEKIRFLLDFVEATSGGVRSKETEADLEIQIARAAHSVEDAIESHVVDQIHAAGSVSKLDLRGVIRRMDFFKKKVTKFKSSIVKPEYSMHVTSSRPQITTHDDKSMIGSDDELIQLTEWLENLGFDVVQPVTYSMDATSAQPIMSTTRDKKSAMIGFDDELIKLMEMLVGGESSRHIITVDGMGGIGKTTLARNTYENPTIVQQFDIRAWVTVSQTYTIKAILLHLVTFCHGGSDDTEAEDYQLGEKLHKILTGRRYLIILDDVWSVNVLEKIMVFLPDNNSRSRIVVTTRLSNMATHFGASCLSIDLLDEGKSWNLFCEKAFDQQGRIPPPELEKIGKYITKKCGGLPLSITVIGGLLRKSSMTQEYWKNVAEDINSILNSRDDEHCLKILSLSYTHLPAHLKPCFLYMGVFPEDHEIRLSRLVKLWVAEGFLKSNETQSPEEIAESYVMDLFSRNLILARRWGVSGKLKVCGIHDLLRDLCLKIAEEVKFLHVINSSNSIPGDTIRDRRLVLNDYRPEDFDVLQSESLVRSLICGMGWETSSELRLLRVLDEVESVYPEIFFHQVNLRYLAARHIQMDKLSSSIFLLWNLQTLIGTSSCFDAPLEIWEMPQLRHLEFGNIHLPDPPSGRSHDFVLWNLQTLTTLVNTRLSEEICQGIPNIRRLGLYNMDEVKVGYDCFGNLGRLHKLQRLSLSFNLDPNRDDLLRNLKLPSSLHKLTLSGCMLRWENLEVIGSLPNLQVLHLNYRSVQGSEWNPIEGHFLALKYLKISAGNKLIRWNADRFHFPILEKLFVQALHELEEIPLDIGEIPTLRLIHLSQCSESSAISALEILQEQEDQGNKDLRVQLQFWCEEAMESFKEKVEPTSNNVQLGVYSEDFHFD